MSVAGYAVVAGAILLASCLQASIGFGIGMLAAPIVALVDPEPDPGHADHAGHAGHPDRSPCANARTSTSPAPGGRSSAGCPAPSPGRCCWPRCPSARWRSCSPAWCCSASCSPAAAGCPPPRRRNVVLAGATSGLLGTATSIGGPPMALVWQRNSGARLRGTMSGFFLIGSVMSIVASGARPVRSTCTRCGCSRVLLPAALAGLRCCPGYVNRLLDPRGCAGLAIGCPRPARSVLIVT